MTKKAVCRRTLIKTSAGYFALPLLPSLYSSRLEANQGTPQIKRVIFFYFPYDSYESVVFPADSVTLMDGAVPYLPLTESNLPDGFQVPELRQHINKMLILRGIDRMGGVGHTNDSFICGRARARSYGISHPHAASIDSIIASNFYHSEPVFRAMHLGGPGNFHISWNFENGNVIENKPIGSPAIAYDLFLGQSIPKADPILLTNKRAKMKSILDITKAEVGDILKSQKMSAGDRLRLEHHLDLVSDLEERLKVQPLPICEKPDRHQLTTYGDEKNRNDRLVDIMFQAIRCDLSRVYTMCQFTGSGSKFHGYDTHNLSHGNRKMERSSQVAATQAISRQIGRFLSQMDSTIEDAETGRSYLDNSLVVWTSNMGSHKNHSWLQKFAVCFGGTGRLNTGKMLDYRGQIPDRFAESPAGRPGRPANEFLISIMRAMGLSHIDWEVGGTPGFGVYNYPKGWRDHYDKFDFGDRRTALPGFFM